MAVPVASFLLRTGFALLALLAAPGVQSTSGSDIRIQVRSKYDTAAGPIAGFVAALAGGGDNGTAWTIVRHGDRIASRIDEGMGERGLTGVPDWIVDFTAQSTYRLSKLDPKTRKYELKTFRQILNEVAGAHRSGQSATADERMFGSSGDPLPKQSRARAKRFTFETTLKLLDEKKTIAGLECRQAVLQVVAFEEGKNLENDGGWVATSIVWIGPRLPAVDAAMDLQRQYRRMVSAGVFEAAFSDIELRMSEYLDPIMPEHVFVAARVLEEMRKLPGTILASNTVYDLERSAAEQKRARSSPKSTRMITMDLEFISIQTSTTQADVAVPTGFVVAK
jgi:hypothetical protein